MDGSSWRRSPRLVCSERWYHRASETPPLQQPTSVADLATRAGCSTDRIEADGIVRPRIPDGLPHVVEQIFGEVLPVKLPPMEVVTIPAGIVSGADGWISRDGSRTAR